MKLFLLESIENINPMTERLRGRYLTHIYLFNCTYFVSSFIFFSLIYVTLVNSDCTTLTGRMTIKLKTTRKGVVVA